MRPVGWPMASSQGVLDGGDHAVGHRRLVHPERGVDRADHPVQALQQLVRVVQRPVREDVGLGAGEDRDRRPGASFSAATSSIRASSASGVTWSPKPCDAEWSVTARYSHPRRSAVLAPSARASGARRESVVWQCRSPRRSLELDQPRQRAVAPRRRAPRGPRAARAGSTRSRAARRPPPRSRTSASCRPRRTGSRTRDTCSPRRTAASRSCTLWALAPVKCCRTLPNWSGATTRRSTFIPGVRHDPRARVAGGRDRLHQRQLGQRRDQAPDVARRWR